MKSTIIKGIVLAEVVAVLGSFHVWRSMNSSQEYRKYMHDNYPKVLEGFYKSADLAGYGSVKELDGKQWKSEN